MQFQPPAVIVVLQEICQIAHDMEMGIDWIAHGENASRKVIMFLVFPVCPLQRRPFPMVINSDGVSLSERHEGLFRDENCRSEEHTSELQSLMRISYAVFCLKKKNKYN